MAPKIYLIFIFILLIASIYILLIPLVRFKKWNFLRKLIFWIIGIALFTYTYTSWQKLLHYNQTNQLDKFYLGMMFSEYVEKFGDCPKTYNDLRKASMNVRILVEKDFFYYSPRIMFLIDDKNKKFIYVTFYECGYDGIDDKLSKIITSPLSIFGINVRGDFFIDKQRFNKNNINEFQSIY